MFTGLGAAAVGAGLSAASSWYMNRQNLKANKQRFDAEVELANTAHQREVRDLIAAGLNPILSSGNAGASVPQPASYEASSIGEGFGGIAAALNSAASAEVNSANADKLKADVAKADFMAQFYQSPLGQDILKAEAIKKAVPENAIQAAGMAGMAVSHGVPLISTNTSNPKANIVSPIADKIARRLSSAYKDMPTPKTSENMRRKFKHK